MPPPVITTAPLAGCVTDSMFFGPPSVSVSLASTSTAVAPESSSTLAESLTASGASSTHSMSTETVAFEPPLSV